MGSQIPTQFCGAQSFSYNVLSPMETSEGISRTLR